MYSYSKGLIPFSPVNIELLRDLDEISKDYTGKGFAEPEEFLAGEKCQIVNTPGGVLVGFFQSAGGIPVYMVDGNRKFIEGVDFVFI